MRYKYMRLDADSVCVGLEAGNAPINDPDLVGTKDHYPIDRIGLKYLGSRSDYDHSAWEGLPPLPELPPTEVLTLEAVASLYEKTEALQAKVEAIESASFAALEGIAALAESQMTE